MVNKANHNDDEASASPVKSAASSSSSVDEPVESNKAIKKKRPPKILLPLIRAIPKGLRRRLRSATLRPIHNPDLSTARPASTLTSVTTNRPLSGDSNSLIDSTRGNQGPLSTLADFPEPNNRSSPSSSTNQSGENGIRHYPVNRINVDPAGQKKPSYFERIQNKFSTAGTGLNNGTVQASAPAARPKAAVAPPPSDPRPVAAKFVRQRDGNKGPSTNKKASGSKGDRRARQLKDLGFIEPDGSGAGSPTPPAADGLAEEYELDTFITSAAGEPPPPDYFSSALEETGASNEDDLLEQEIAPSDPQSAQSLWQAFEPATDTVVMYNSDGQPGEFQQEAAHLLEDEILAGGDHKPLVPPYHQKPEQQHEDEDGTRETSIQIESMSADEDDMSSPLKPSGTSPEQTGIIISAPALAQSLPPAGPSMFLPDDKHDVGLDGKNSKKGEPQSTKRTKTRSTMTNAGSKRKKERPSMRKAKSLDAVEYNEHQGHRRRSRRDDQQGTKEQRDRALVRAREALAKRLKDELLAKQQQKPESLTFKGAIAWLFDFTASCIICASLTALVFLIPIVANPALVSLDAKFSAATDCRVCGNVTRKGLTNCTWTSCREGCTADIYRCSHIWVMYNPEPGDCGLEVPPESQELFEAGETDCDETVPLPPPSISRPSSSSFIPSSLQQPCPKPRRARLVINALSCGYPPEVNCSMFLHETVAKVDKCQYSRRDPSLAVPSFDSDDALRILLLSMFVPVAATAVSSVYLCWRFCEMDIGISSISSKKNKASRQALRDQQDEAMRKADENMDESLMDEDRPSGDGGGSTSNGNEDKLKTKSKSDTDIPKNDGFRMNHSDGDDDDDDDEDYNEEGNGRDKDTNYGAFRRRHPRQHARARTPSSSRHHRQQHEQQQRQYESSTTTVSTLLGGVTYVADVEMGNVDGGQSGKTINNDSAATSASSSAGGGGGLTSSMYEAGRHFVSSRPGSSTATTTAATTSPYTF